MNKYTQCQQSVFDFFASTEWTNTGIQAMPNNFTAPTGDSEFIRIAVIPSRRGLNINSTYGQIIIDIFTSANAGPLRYAEIADILDSMLVGKSKSVPGGTLQVADSYLSPHGADKMNASIHRATYGVTFNFYGVS